MPKNQQQAINAELMPLSQYLVIEVNLTFGTFPPDPGTPGDPREHPKTTDLRGH